MKKQNPLYDPGFVRSLFDEMAQTYGLVNLLTSFGFTLWWRKKCARAISVKPDSVVVDLMAGMGELSTHVGKSLNENGKLIAIDISSEMCRRAERHCFCSQYQSSRPTLSLARWTIHPSTKFSQRSA